MKRRTRRKMSKKAWNRLTRHHNIAKSLGGQLNRQNIYLLTAEHHQAYHTLFGLRTFEEAEKLLRAYDILFGGRNFEEAANVLLRMQQLHERKGLKRGECE